MRAQTLNACKRVGVRVTSLSYWKHGVEEKATLGRESSQLAWENRGNLYGGIMQFFTFIFGMNNKQGAGKKSTGARPGRLGNFRSMLEHFLSILELKIEEPGCQA
jgi:hypothetical protein